MNIISGIYCFENIINRNKYIGQSQDVLKRQKEHLWALRNKKYQDSKYFQYAWNKYGENNFRFWVIEKCSIDLLSKREIYWIKKLHSHTSEGGYNISWGGEAFMRGSHPSKKTIQKMILNHVGMTGKKHSEKTKKKQSISHMGENNPTVIDKKIILAVSNLLKKGIKVKDIVKATNAKRMTVYRTRDGYYKRIYNINGCNNIIPPGNLIPKEIVLQIKILLNNNISRQNIHDKLNVSFSTIQKVKNGCYDIFYNI